MITSWTPSQLAQITDGAWNQTPEQRAQMTIEIDHRLLGDHGLFIALPGERHDGHDFIKELKKGHCALVRAFDETSDNPQLCVSEPLEALHKLAREAMATTSAKKIAITGSVGKTSTKQALYDVLSCFGICHANKGNYNNHIGAPLSMARTADEADLVIVEMGMNAPGEIRPLSQLFDGDIAIITKIADSHIGFFNNVTEIAYAKAEIFDGMTSGTAILPIDDDHYSLLADKARAKGLDIVSFGTSDEAHIQLLQATSNIPTSQLKGQQLKIRHKGTGQIYDIDCGLSAPHHATTALIILACLDVLDLPWDKARHALADLREVQGRGDQQTIKWQSTSTLLINDSYNAGPASMRASLDYIASLPHMRKALILTEMLELGQHAQQAHHALLPQIKAVEASLIILVGDAFAEVAESLSQHIDCHHFHSADEAKEALGRLLDEPDLIFIKGSNGSGAPRLASHLLQNATSLTAGEALHVS